MSDSVDGRSAARCRNTIVVCAPKRHFSSDPAHPGLRHVTALCSRPVDVRAPSVTLTHVCRPPPAPRVVVCTGG
eukprot:580110-Prymnesium_polylepis.1